jgi:hypothetical protein
MWALQEVLHRQKLGGSEAPLQGCKVRRLVVITYRLPSWRGGGKNPFIAPIELATVQLAEARKLARQASQPASGRSTR